MGAHPWPERPQARVPVCVEAAPLLCTYGSPCVPWESPAPLGEGHQSWGSAAHLCPRDCSICSDYVQIKSHWEVPGAQTPTSGCRGDKLPIQGGHSLNGDAWSRSWNAGHRDPVLSASCAWVDSKPVAGAPGHPHDFTSRILYPYPINSMSFVLFLCLGTRE